MFKKDHKDDFLRSLKIQLEQQRIKTENMKQDLIRLLINEEKEKTRTAAKPKKPARPA